MNFGLAAYDLLREMYLEEFRRAGEAGWAAAAAAEPPIEPEKIPSAILRNNLFGIDIDPVALRLARASLALKSGATPPDDAWNLWQGGRAVRRIAWPPLRRRFDVVVTNPPYAAARRAAGRSRCANEAGLPGRPAQPSTPASSSVASASPAPAAARGCWPCSRSCLPGHSGARESTSTRTPPSRRSPTSARACSTSETPGHSRRSPSSFVASRKRAIVPPRKPLHSAWWSCPAGPRKKRRRWPRRFVERAARHRSSRVAIGIVRVASAGLGLLGDADLRGVFFGCRVWGRSRPRDRGWPPPTMRDSFAIGGRWSRFRRARRFGRRPTCGFPM